MLLLLFFGCCTCKFCNSRINSYTARFVVKAIEGVWKITDLELLEESRIDPNAPPASSGGPSGT